MNFSKIIAMQKKLDLAYARNGSLNNDFINEKRIVAILVEVGELANEYAPFKYWKKQKIIDKNKVLEEFVDGIHFFATIINNLNMNVTQVKGKIMHADQSMQLAHTFKTITKLFEKINPKTVLEAFEIYLGNAQLIGITNQEIEKAYRAKNHINYTRIKAEY